MLSQPPGSQETLDKSCGGPGGQAAEDWSVGVLESQGAGMNDPDPFIKTLASTAEIDKG
jgi:hypothetical protein